ncbi:unnamed protein product [Caretta caretta]
MFSGIDSSYYSGSLNWIPLSYWEITMDSITMNGHLISCANGWQAIVDTGTSVLAGAPMAISKILHYVGARGISSNLISCSAKHTLPDIIFTINSIRFPLPATAYIRQEKAFDRMDQGYLLGTLWAFDFRPQFVGFLPVLYADLECLVSFEWGVRQRCPKSGQLYTLEIEPFL